MGLAYVAGWLGIAAPAVAGYILGCRRQRKKGLLLHLALQVHVLSVYSACGFRNGDAGVPMEIWPPLCFHHLLRAVLLDFICRFVPVVLSYWSFLRLFSMIHAFDSEY